ncbi:hypothetical protein K1W54_04650 [Micromonospora sp. CPCC 205371]|nr:hypothetical protein [Micromonospora sp. CPCC 205371]
MTGAQDASGEELAQIPLLLQPPAVSAGEPDPFVTTLIELMRRNLADPAAANAMMPLTAAAGWCAPPDPNRPLPPVPDVPRLACGCPEAVLETGHHQPECDVIGVAPLPTE